MTRVQHVLRTAKWPLTAGIARLRQFTPRPTRFAGHYPTRVAALAAAGPGGTGYDNEAVAEVSFERMCRVATWDYPVLYWLQELLEPGQRVLDAGGHMGTKYIAFREYLDLGGITWTVYDLPGIVKAARTLQAGGRIPAEIRFVDMIGQDGTPDVFLGSGLMQYVDRPLADLIGDLPELPENVLLNKVAVTEGETRFTLERIGPAQVPYQIRNRAAFEGEITALGYEIRDSWIIPSLAHRVPTHPWLGESESRGYTLVRKSPDSSR